MPSVVLCVVCQDPLVEKPKLTNLSILTLDSSNVKDNNEIIAASCGDLYHLYCMNKWLSCSKHQDPGRSCPKCDAVILSDGCRKIFPSCDESSDEVAEKSNTKKIKQILQPISAAEIYHKNMIRDEMKEELNEKFLAQDIIRFESQMSKHEIQCMKDELEIKSKQMELLDFQRLHMLEQDKVDIQRYLARIQTLELKLAKQKKNLNDVHNLEIRELNAYINKMKLQNRTLEMEMKLIHRRKGSELVGLSKKPQQRINSTQTDMKNQNPLTIHSRINLYDQCMKHIAIERNILSTEFAFNVSSCKSTNNPNKNSEAKKSNADANSRLDDFNVFYPLYAFRDEEYVRIMYDNMTPGEPKPEITGRISSNQNPEVQVTAAPSCNDPQPLSFKEKMKKLLPFTKKK